MIGEVRMSLDEFIQERQNVIRTDSLGSVGIIDLIHHLAVFRHNQTLRVTAGNVHVFIVADVIL